MTLTKREIERINIMNPVSNDVKLGDKIAELEQGEDVEVDAYTKEESDDKFQPKGSYATTEQLETKSNKGESYTKDESDGKYQTKGTYVSQEDFNALVTRVEALENAGEGS